MTTLTEGDVIELVSMMEDDPDPIPRGTKGTVTWVGPPVSGLPGIAPYDQVSVRWENGRTLGLCIPPDRVRVVERADG